MLEGKNIVLGISGSIAAYKSALLVRLLIKSGANVQVVMTPGATEFITPLTLSTLSKNPVHTHYFNTENGEWDNHVELGLWADLMIIAPATANTLAKMANGLCDNLLTAVYLSAKCPVYFAPAMDLDMWQHPSTKQNTQRLIDFGNILIPAGVGELASGLHGEGRMAEPEEIMELLTTDLKKKLPLRDKKIIVTAGPTYEAIDPVRFIGNHSSGKMGFAIADELTTLGASVTLIAGPTSQISKQRTIKRIDVVSAADMLAACLNEFADSDGCIMNAAVADYTLETIAKQKIKKNDGPINIDLKKTTDILKTLGERKRDHQILIGFALETENEEEYAIQKLKKKNLDLIILNSLNDKGAGFKTDTNKVTFIDKNLQKTIFTLKSKNEVAHDICEKVIQLMT